MFVILRSQAQVPTFTPPKRLVDLKAQNLTCCNCGKAGNMMSGVTEDNKEFHTKFQCPHCGDTFYWKANTPITMPHERAMFLANRLAMEHSIVLQYRASLLTYNDKKRITE